MDKLFALYRYLNEEKDGYNGHKSAFKALDLVCELLQSLDEWGQYILDNKEIDPSSAKAIEEQIVQACQEILISCAGDALHAIQNMAEQHLPLRDCDHLIANLEKLRGKPYPDASIGYAQSEYGDEELGGQF
jgi:hypothetical protein